jgi:hypothetical protein
MTSPCMIRCEECLHLESESCVGKDSVPRYPITAETDKLDMYIYSKMQSGATIKSMVKDALNILYEDIAIIVDDLYTTTPEWDRAVAPIKKAFCIESKL